MSAACQLIHSVLAPIGAVITLAMGIIILIVKNRDTVPPWLTNIDRRAYWPLGIAGFFLLLDQFAPAAPTSDEIALRTSVYREINSVCHDWGDYSARINPEAGPGYMSQKLRTESKYLKIVSEIPIPQYSQDNFNRMSPLFVQGVKEIDQRWHATLSAYPSGIEADVLHRVLETRLHLKMQASNYLRIPSIADSATKAGMFEGMIQGHVRTMVDGCNYVGTYLDRLRSQ